VAAERYWAQARRRLGAKQPASHPTTRDGLGSFGTGVITLNFRRHNPGKKEMFRGRNFYPGDRSSRHDQAFGSWTAYSQRRHGPEPAREEDNLCPVLTVGRWPTNATCTR